MKKIILFLLLPILISSCSSNRYLLADKGNDKNYLAEIIKEKSKAREISTKPLIVVDGVPCRYDLELKNKKLELLKEEISTINGLKHDAGIAIYGHYADGGVLIITTKSYAIKHPESLDKKNILFLLGDKAISNSEVEKISPDDIESIDVIKGKEKIKGYTQENYDGVIIIHLKKKN